MKGRTVALDQLDGREAAALVVDGQLEDLLVEAPDHRIGDIYRARVDRLVKGQGGIFLTLPNGRGYLRKTRGLAPGQHLLVQVSSFPEPGKAVAVSDRLIFKSRYVIVTPGAPGVNISRSIGDDDRVDQLKRIVVAVCEELSLPNGTGLILRSSCAAAEDNEIEEDLHATARIASQVLNDPGHDVEKLLEGDSPHAVAWREWWQPATLDADPHSFERHGILDLLDDLRGAQVPLGAGHMWVEATHALIAVDVNTGSDTSPAAALKTNLAAARALPRALALRGLGGQITIDFAPLAKKDRKQVEAALRKACRADPVETEVIGWTPLGHLELKRKRERWPLI